MTDADPAALMTRFAAAWNGGEAAAIAALFADDADFVNVVGLWWRRRRDIEKAHAYGFERIFRGARLAFERVQVRKLDPAVATIHGLWQMTGQVQPDGSPAEPRRGVLLLVAQRRGDAWVAVTAQNTDIVRGADTMLAQADGLRGASYLDRRGRPRQ